MHIYCHSERSEESFFEMQHLKSEIPNEVSIWNFKVE